jgi:hypothetical protein
MSQVNQIDEARIQDHLGEMVCGTVLNAMLGALTGFAARGVTSAARLGRIPGR